MVGAVLVVMVSESFAHRFWPAYPNGQDPVGQHILLGAGRAPKDIMQIVGIVADVHQSGLDAGPSPELYAPYGEIPPQSVMLAVRTKGHPLQFVNVVRSRIRAIDPDQPISAVKTMNEVVEASLSQPRLIAPLLGVFAGVALLLAIVGSYGMISYSAAQRTQEMGIRLALGAEPTNILRLVVSQALGLVLVGVALGLGGAVALTQVMKSLLFHVSATDPVTFAGIAGLLIVVALLASYIPAQRAARVDPSVALRHE